MFFRKMFALFIVLLIVAALLGAGRRGEYQAGYAQGYVAGQQAAGQLEGGSTAALPPPSPVYAPHAYPGFGFFGFLFKAFAFFFGFMLLLGFMGLLFGRRHWRGHGRHWHKWSSEWHKSGHTPPWYGHGEADEPVMKA